MKRAAIVLGSYFAGGLVLFLLAHWLPEHGALRDWMNFLGLIGMSFPITVLIGLLLSLPHELGHIVVGRRRGFQLFGLSLMGFTWLRYSGRDYWKWDMQGLFFGQRMLAKKDPSLKDIRLLLIAGPITSLIMASAWSPFLWFQTTLPLGILAVGANVLYGVSSLIPTYSFNSGGSRNDGTYLWMSYKNPRELVKSYELHYERVAEWLRPSNRNLQPVILSGDAHVDCCANLDWYWKKMDGGRIIEAEPYLRNALNIARENPEPKTYIIEASYEAAVFYRRFRQDEELSTLADELCESLAPDNAKSSLVDGARLWAAGKKTEAIEIWEEFSKRYLADHSDPGSQVHGRDWFIRLRTEEMLFETDRLFVRPWTMDDLDVAFDIYRRIEVMQYLGREPKPVASIEEATEMMNRWIANQAARPVGQGSWAIVRKEDERIIGTVMCKALPNNDMEPSGELEIGWHLHPDAWGRGYATEAAKAVAEYGFRMDPNLQRVLAVIYTENQASQKVAKSIGMTYQGVSNDYYGMALELFELKRPTQSDEPE